MNKINIALKTVKAVIVEGGSFTLRELLAAVNYRLDIEEMVSMSTLRRAVRLLPQDCIDRTAHGLVIHARQFAKPQEVLAALRTLPHWCEDSVVLIENHKQTLRELLLLDPDPRPLYHSLNWAAHGNFEIDYTVYGESVRMLRSKRIVGVSA